MDADDEVRDRATYFKAILEQHEASLNSQYILNSLAVSISSLEKSLHAYTLDQSATAKPFDMKSVPAAAIEDKKPSASAATVGLTSKPDKPTTTATSLSIILEWNTFSVHVSAHLSWQNGQNLYLICGRLPIDSDTI